MKQNWYIHEQSSYNSLLTSQNVLQVHDLIPNLTELVVFFNQAKMNFTFFKTLPLCKAKHLNGVITFFFDGGKIQLCNYLWLAAKHFSVGGKKRVYRPVIFIQHKRRLVI